MLVESVCVIEVVWDCVHGPDRNQWRGGRGRENCLAGDGGEVDGMKARGESHCCGKKWKGEGVRWKSG